MSKIFSAERFRTLVSDWVGRTSPPDIANLPAAIGSLGIAGNTPHEIYLKTGGGSTGSGWTQQNLVGLRIFNVRKFGAVGNNVTNDRPAIQSAITAATAAGGGIVYFPPGQYVIYKTGIGDNYYFDLSNVQDITFLGDGRVSQIRMSGNQFLSLSVIFRIRNFSARIRFYNLFMDAANAIINPHVTEQNHMVQPDGLPGDPVNSGSTDIEISECFWGDPIGDAVRLVGNDQRVISNIRVTRNSFNCVDGFGVPAARSCISIQRGVTNTLISHNFVKGSHDQQIDFEPSGSVEPIARFRIVGNHLDHQSQNTESVTLGGLTASLATDLIVAHNTITNGGGWNVILTSHCTLLGNIVVCNAPGTVGVPPAAPLNCQNANDHFSVLSNIFAQTDATNTVIPITIIATSTPNSEVVIRNNLVRAVNGGFAGNGAGIGDFAALNQFALSGNIWTGVVTVTSHTMVRLRSGTLVPMDHAQISGELIVSDSAATVGSVLFLAASNAMNVRNLQVGGNYTRNTNAVGASVIQYDATGGAVFTDWRYTGDNMAIGGATSSVLLPLTNVGITGCGPAGPGSQVDVVALAAGPNTVVTAPAGSICSNTAGGNSTILWAKETGVGVSGGASGWFAIGSHQFEFGVLDTGAGTGALFLATGTELATASATQLQLALPRPGQVRNYRVKQVAGVGAGTISYVVRKNGSAQSGTITINFTATTGGPVGNFAAVAGDLISVVITKSQAPGTNPTFAVLTMEIAN